MYIDRHSLALLLEWAHPAPGDVIDEQELRRWLTTLVDRATNPARVEFAKAVADGEYPLNAVRPRGGPQNPSDVSLTIDRGPPALILLVNEAMDPDLRDPGNKVTGTDKETLLRTLALWDAQRLPSMIGPEGWRIQEDQPVEPPPESPDPQPDDSPQPPVDQPSDQPSETPSDQPGDTPSDPPGETQQPTEQPTDNNDWNKILMYGGGALVALGGAWLWMRARKQQGAVL